MEESVPTSVRLVPSAQESRPRWQILVVTLHPSQALHTTFPYLTAALSEHVDIVQARTREAFNHYLQTNVPVAVIFTDNEVIYPVTSAYGHLNGAFKKLHLYLMQKRTTVICACHWGRLFRPSHWTFFREMFEREWDHGGRYRITCFASQPCVTHLPVIVEGGAPIPYTPTATFAMVGQDGPVNELIYEFANGARSVEDNFLNGIVRLEKILGVDHLLNYKPPRTSPVAMGRYRNGQYICYVGDWKTGSIESSLEAGGDQSIDIILAMCRFAALRLTEPFLDPQGYVLHLFNIKKPLTVLERKPLWRTNAKYGFHRSRHEHGIHAERSSSKQPLRQSGSTESAVFKLWTDGSREARYDRQLRSPTANFVFERGYWAYRWDVGGIDDVILETMGLDSRNIDIDQIWFRFNRDRNWSQDPVGFPLALPFRLRCLPSGRIIAPAPEEEPEEEPEGPSEGDKRVLFHYDEDQPGKSYFFIPAGASLSHRPFGRAGAHQQSVPPAPPPSEDLKGHSVSYHCPPYNRLDWPRSRLSRPGKSQPSKVSKVCSSATSSVPVETAGVKFDEFVGGNNNIEHRKDLGVPIVETEKETGLPEPILMPRTPRISQLPLPDDEGQPTDIGTVPGATSDYVPEWGASTPPGPSNAPPRRLPPGIPISGMRSYATIEPAPQNLSLDRRRSRKSSQTEHRGVAQHRQPICQRPKTYVDLVARERIPKPRPKRESSARESSAPKNVKLMTTNHLKWRLLILRRLNELYQRQQYDMAYDLSQYLSAWDDAWSSHTGSGNSLRDCAVEDDDLKEMSVDNSLAAGGRAQLESSGVLELKETNRKRQMTSAFGEPLPEKYQKNATDRVIWDPKVLAQLRQTFVHNGTNSDPTRAPRSRLGMELGLRSWDNHQSRSELSGMSELTNLVVTSADEKKEVDEQDRENADEVEKKHGNGTEGESANERTTKGT